MQTDKSNRPLELKVVRRIRLVAEILKIRKGRKLGGISLRSLIEEGRRY